MATTIIQPGTGTTSVVAGTGSTTVVLPGARGPAGAAVSLESQQFSDAVRVVGNGSYAPLGTAVQFDPAWRAGFAYTGSWIVINAGTAYIGQNVPARATFTPGDWTALTQAAAAALGVTFNPDGTVSFSPVNGGSFTDNGDGTYSTNPATVDNGDGTGTFPA